MAQEYDFTGMYKMIDYDFNVFIASFDSWSVDKKIAWINEKTKIFVKRFASGGGAVTNPGFLWSSTDTYNSPTDFENKISSLFGSEMSSIHFEHNDDSGMEL